MKTARNTLFALLLLGGTAGATSASAQLAADIHVGPSGRASVDVGFFYDDLASYGNWIERPSYGWVWTPRAVSTSWRPYREGHWVWTDQGWTWLTDEPYGWATYHYGRWYDDPEIGWSWVPGDEWAPSWVSWQEGSDYIGWAPLPPGVNVGVAFGSGGYAYGIAPDYYNFVPERSFLSPRLGSYYLGAAQIGPIFGRTRNFTNYRFDGGRVFNQGVPVDRIQRFAGRVPRYQVADLGYGRGNNWRQARLQGNRVAFFRPQVQKAARIASPANRPGARRAVTDAAQFRAAHPNRIVSTQRAQVTQQRQQRAEVRGQNQALRQQQKGVQQRQAQNLRQQTRATQQRQAQASRQQEKGAQQRQAQASRQQEKAVQQRQAQSFRQQQRGAQQRQAQASRQQERAAQQRQAQSFRQQQRGTQQRQAQASRQQQRGAQQRQAAQQSQRQQQRAGGGGPRAQQRQGQAQRQGQGQGHHGRPPGQ
jgi:hypothetical protein